MENKVIESAEKILNKKVKFVKRLLGGMSNYTCVIQDEDNKLYTFRFPGKNAENFVDRNEEKFNLNLLNDFSLTNQTVYINVENGIKISKFIEGEILSQLDYKKYLKQCALSLRKLHKIDKKCFKDYGKLERLEKYEKLCISLNLKLEEQYYNYKEVYMNLYNKFSNVEKKFSHGDFQPSNLILKNNQIYIVDFEFTSNNDPFYDIACFGNLDFEDAKNLLVEYLERPYTDLEYLRLIENRLFQTLQWYLVASYKDIIGLSQDLHLDFDKIAKNYLLKSAALINLL